MEQKYDLRYENLMTGGEELMAICAKIHSIKVRLDERINYAITADKTKALVDKIDYAINESKTEHALYASTINCDSVETAYDEMNEVKIRYRKTDNVIGYTFIQSFSPQEKITPLQAHDIGVRLAQEFFGDRFQVVVGTHVDKAHLHNHFVINSVSFIDGKKYLNKLHYLNDIRTISDRLCAERGLSIVIPKKTNSTEPYKDWKDRANGIPPRNDIMRADIDDCIRQSLSFEDFMFNLKKLGYSIPRYGPNVKHMSIRAPGAERARRLDDLNKTCGGEDKYTEKAIRRRIAENTPEMVMQAIQATRSSVEKESVPTSPKFVRVKWNGKRRMHKKLKGLQARYYRMLYTFGMIRQRPRSQTNRAMYFSLYDQLRQFDGYIRQMKLLSSCNVKTVDELSALRESSSSEITALIAKRRTLYRHPDNADGGLKVEIDKLTVRIAELRRIVRDCEAIEARSAATVQRIRDVEQHSNEQKRKNTNLRDQLR